MFCIAPATEQGKQSSVCFPVSVGRLKQKGVQLATKSSGRRQQLQLGRQRVPCSPCADRESPVADSSTCRRNCQRQLHWLSRPTARPVHSGIRLVRQSLSGQAPLYLADDWRLVSDSTRRSLRSADVSTCVLPPTLSSYVPTELLQPPDFACATLFQSSCVILTSSTDCSDDS